MNSGYNPEFNPTGIEGGLDTNALPWLSSPLAPNLQFKPLRASNESGMFSTILRIEAGDVLPETVYLNAMDLFVLAGELTFPDGPFKGSIEPGVFGYVPANTRIQRMTATQATELLCNFYGPVAFVDSNQIQSIFTSMDLLRLANDNGIALVPNTLADCMQPRQAAPEGGVPLAINSGGLGQLAADIDPEQEPGHPHFVDTRAVEWIVNPGLPDIALKVLRVSEETGITSLIVRHNGVAGPHYHLGAADFLILSGHIGYRAGPPEGYGPGVWFFEPAGARHEATQRIGDHEDLIYTANVYGPVQFDDGPDTAITAVQSWMQYKMLADASGIRLVQNTLPGDTTHLAWSPLGNA